VLWGPRQM